VGKRVTARFPSVAARVLPVELIENLSCIENHFNKSSVINMPIGIEDIIIGKVVVLDKDYSLTNPAFSSRSGEHLVVLSLDKSESSPKANILVTDNKEDATTVGNIVSRSEVTQEEQSSLDEIIQKHRTVLTSVFHLQRMLTTWRDLFPRDTGDGTQPTQQPQLFDGKTFVLKNFPIFRGGIVAAVFSGDAKCTMKDEQYSLSFNVNGAEGSVDVSVEFLRTLDEKLEPDAMQVGSDLPILGSMPSVTSLVKSLKSLPATKGLIADEICRRELFVVALHAGMRWVAPAMDNPGLRKQFDTMVLKELASLAEKVNLSKKPIPVDAKALGILIKSLLAVPIDVDPNTNGNGRGPTRMDPPFLGGGPLPTHGGAAQPCPVTDSTVATPFADGLQKLAFDQAAFDSFLTDVIGMIEQDDARARYAATRPLVAAISLDKYLSTCGPRADPKCLTARADKGEKLSREQLGAFLFSLEAAKEKRPTSPNEGTSQNTVRVIINNDKKDDGEEGTVIRSAGSTLALDAHARARLEQMEKLVQASDFEELNRMIRAESSKDLRTLLFSSKKIDTGALSGERYTFKIEPSPTG
jgi:hypothetical protein